MKFLEVKDGFSVAIKTIITIEEVNELVTLVSTKFGNYEVALPYRMVLSFIEEPEEKEPPIKPEVMAKLDGFLDNVGTFAGR